MDGVMVVVMIGSSFFCQLVISVSLEKIKFSKGGEDYCKAAVEIELVYRAGVECSKSSSTGSRQVDNNQSKQKHGKDWLSEYISSSLLVAKTFQLVF
jgi:hypothetical protein